MAAKSARTQTQISDLKAMQAFAAAWAKKVRPGMVLGLVGDLRAGKTTFTRYFCEAIKSQSHVSSPTFTLENQYRGKWPVYHIDCYRLDSIEAFVKAGLDAHVPSEDGVTILEWANKFPELLPAGSVMIEFKIVDEEQRQVESWVS